MIEYDFRPECEQCNGQGGWATNVSGIIVGVSTCSKYNGSGKSDYPKVTLESKGGGE
jgi:DnaJ-class molecular chaperone